MRRSPGCGQHVVQQYACCHADIQRVHKLLLPRRQNCTGAATGRHLYLHQLCAATFDQGTQTIALVACRHEWRHGVCGAGCTGRQATTWARWKVRRRRFCAALQLVSNIACECGTHHLVCGWESGTWTSDRVPESDMHFQSTCQHTPGHKCKLAG